MVGNSASPSLSPRYRPIWFGRDEQNRGENGQGVGQTTLESTSASRSDSPGLPESGLATRFRQYRGRLIDISPLQSVSPLDFFSARPIKPSGIQDKLQETFEDMPSATSTATTTPKRATGGANGVHGKPGGTVEAGKYAIHVSCNEDGVSVQQTIDN